ncbi:MAG TPA: hypothetical protein VK107_01420 [Alloiococcus sp.]|nr:hypothetical protein [Alloiococcus sp.]
MLSEQQGKYIAYLSFALSIVGFFIFGKILGLIAIAISVFGLLKTENKTMNWNALTLGAIAVIIAFI